MYASWRLLSSAWVCCSNLDSVVVRGESFVSASVRNESLFWRECGGAHLAEALLPARVELLDERDALLGARALALDLLAEAVQARTRVERDAESADQDADDEEDHCHQDQRTLEIASDGVRKEGTKNAGADKPCGPSAPAETDPIRRASFGSRTPHSKSCCERTFRARPRLRSGCYRGRAVAKKTRTPAPPRPVQAPQRRGKGGKGAAGDNRSKWLLIAFAVSGVVGLAAVAAVIALTNGGGGGDTANAANVGTTLQAAGCTFKTVKATGRTHVTSLDAKIKYNTTPPSNGNHYFSPATWGFYASAANPIQVVHNEEHGGVIIWWGDKVPQATIDKLHDFYSSSPNGMLGTPYPTLGNKIALTAWTSPEGGTGQGRIAICNDVQRERLHGVPRRIPRQGPRALPAGHVDAGRLAAGHAGVSSAAPGWRNWRYAADLKSAAPTGA